MRKLKRELIKRQIKYEKLETFGFFFDGEKYTYKKDVLSNKFSIIISILQNNEISSSVYDNINDEEFTLVDVKNATGSFIGEVKIIYEELINSFIESCTTLAIYKNPQTLRVIEFIKDKYNSDLEYLWADSPGAIWRHKDTTKWFGLLQLVPLNRFKIENNKIEEVLNLKYRKEEISNIIDYKCVFPGFHMNKKSWISIILDDRLEDIVIFNLIENSFNIG